MAHGAPSVASLLIMGSQVVLHDLSARLERAAQLTAQRGLDALLVTPGPDMRYLCGYNAIPLERLTALLVTATGATHLIAPALEGPAAQASPVGELNIPIHTWEETQDPYSLVYDILGDVNAIALDNHMWAERVVKLRALRPNVEQRLANEVISPMRTRKSATEIEHLRAAGAAIDHVHAHMHKWLRAGRTEEEIGRDIADAILEAGHATVDFVIVASGPNGASPHHETSNRVIEAGDPVVVDIGGTMPSGYCSDSTRMYCLGKPPQEFVEYYAVLHQAQRAAVAHVRPGVSAQSVDEAARSVIDAAGFGPYFIHRTGHGIGLETHEEPYIVAGNEIILEEGMAFSIEPGIYLPGRHGARIEDIVACGSTEADVLNLRPTELIEL